MAFVTRIINRLDYKIGHDFSQGCIIFSASIENVFYYFVQLIHFKIKIL